MSESWRLILDQPASGAWNMAVDEAVLEAVGRGDSLPTLRLYAWDPPCLSLGYAQPFADVDLPELLSRGWQVVRRPTGGRAILHTDELTYAVISPPGEMRVQGSVLESYNRIAQVLLAAVQSLGIPVMMKEQSVPSVKTAAGPVCFDVPSTYEITVNGKKLIGSAQARRKEGVLQHGTFPLTGDLTRILQALVFPDESSRGNAAERLLARAVTASSILGREVEWSSAAEAFVKAFEQVFDLSLEKEGLSEKETTRAEELVKEKYAHPNWTERV